MNKRKEKRKKRKIFAKSRFSGADEPQNKKSVSIKKEFGQIFEPTAGINGIMIDLRECGLKQTSF